MWWPRPRWKSDFLARLILLVSITISTTSNVVMADEGQHCGGSNLPAMIWTSVLCTMILVLIVVVIYFVYCKKKEHDWSSLWWKSNSDKNIVLQTSPPTNGQLRKIGGTDNPAFLADSYVVSRVTKTGLNKIVHVSTLNDGLLGAELSMKEEDGKKIFMCKHNNGSKERLIAMRLVFDEGQQQLCGPLSDLSRALVELSREYGLQVELETEGVTPVTSSNAIVENCEEKPEKRAKPNLLSVVRGTAQRLWHQRPVVFKSGDDNSRIDADIKENCNDVESGRAATVTSVATGLNTPISEPKSSCVVKTVDETTSAASVVQSPRVLNGGVSLQYRTLEYGASPADAMTQSCTDDSIQCCVVNSSGPVATTTVTAAAPDKDRDAVTSVENTFAKPALVKDDEPKHVAANPPPPPPRKYSASAASSVPVTLVLSTTTGTATAHVSTAEGDTGDSAVELPSTVVVETIDPLPVVNLAPIKTDRPPLTTTTATTANEIQIDNDYYWCTTTTMAASMSTFGKHPSVTAATCDVDDTGIPGGSSVVTATRSNSDVAVTSYKSAGFLQIDNKSMIAVAAKKDDKEAAAVAAVDDRTTAVTAVTAVNDADIDGDDSRDIVVAGGTTSIEDASLPSFSSDEDDDDIDNNNDDVNAKFKYRSTVITKDAVTSPGSGQCNGDGNGRKCDNVRDAGGSGHKSNSKADESRFNDEGVATVPAPSSTDPKSPTKLPTLRQSLSSPLSSVATTSCFSSSASSTSSTSSSPTNNGSSNNSPIVSKIPVRRQSAGSSSSIISNGGTTVSMSLTNNGSTKKSIPLPLSRSGSRLAMWSSVN